MSGAFDARDAGLDGWREVRLVDLARDFLSGGTPDTKNPAYWGGSIPWITGADIVDQKMVHPRKLLTAAGLRSGSTRVVPKGSLLVVTRTGVGKVAVAPNDVAISQDITGVIPDDHQVEPAFLYWSLARNLERLGKLRQGTTINGILRDDLAALRLLLPPLDQQRRVAEIMSSLESAIEKTEAVVRATEQLRQALVTDLLANGVPGWHREWKEVPEIGVVPCSWSIAALGSLVDRDRPICYGILMPGPDAEGGVPVVKVKDYLNSDLRPDELVRTTTEIDAQYSRSRVREGDILVSIRGTTGRVAVIPAELDGANITQDTARVSIGDDSLRSYTRHYLSSAAAQAFIAKNTIGQAVKGINIGELRKLKVPLPGCKERDLISAAIDSLDARRRAEASYLAALRQVKDTIALPLLTGKFRALSDTEMVQLPLFASG